jgi:hypothetical protein
MLSALSLSLTPCIMALGIADERVEGIWHQILDVFKGGLLADW